MKNCNEKFGNLKAFETHFKPVFIYRMNKCYYVFDHEPKNDPDDLHSWIQAGSIDYIDGWLYGAVQTVCGQIKKKEIEEGGSQK